MVSRLKAYAGIVSVFILAIVVRVAWVGRYPAGHSDEGFWANGARNHVLFGDAFLDHRLHPYLSPGTYVALLGHFSVLSPDLGSARLFSAIMGIATCAIVWVMARRLVPGRPWLPLLFFGVSGFAVLMHRIMLLEAHQTFWLTLAAALLLSRVRGSLVLAGAAYGAALLVKSNSVYVIPAVLLALPASGEASAGATDAAPAEPARLSAWIRSRLVPGALFFGGAVIIAAAGYLIARARDPLHFGWAFQYELASKHFVEEAKDPILFHFGRLGFRPYTAATVTFELVKSDPFMVGLALIAIAGVLRRPRASTREDRFFAAWVLGAYLFDMVQINCTHRYLGPMGPALAFLAARSLDRMFPADAKAPAPLHRRFGAAAVCGALTVYSLARLGVGIFHQQPNRDYWQTVQFIRERVPRDTGVLAAAYISLSLPQRSYDYYRVLRPYDDEDHPLPMAGEVEKRHITVIVRDTLEWRGHETPDMRAFLETHCEKLATFGGFEVFGVLP